MRFRIESEPETERIGRTTGMEFYLSRVCLSALLFLALECHCSYNLALDGGDSNAAIEHVVRNIFPPNDAVLWKTIYLYLYLRIGREMLKFGRI